MADSRGVWQRALDLTEKVDNIDLSQAGAICVDSAVRLAIEVVGCVFIAKKRNLIDEIIFADLYNELPGSIKGIQALRNSLDKPISSSTIN